MGSWCFGLTGLRATSRSCKQRVDYNLVFTHWNGRKLESFVVYLNSVHEDGTLDGKPDMACYPVHKN